MAKAKIDEFVNLVPEDNMDKVPRLVKMIIQNFRCIGSSPVEIDLDDIVVLVGPNNVGKSSIIAAYSKVMSDGSKEGHMSIEDFHNKDQDNNIVIEIHTEIYTETPGERWIDTETSRNIIKERWTWSQPGLGKRQGYDVEAKMWSDQVPWGAPNVAKSRRPIPIYVDAFASPATQSDQLLKLLLSILNEKIKDIISMKDNDHVKALTETIIRLQNAIRQNSDEAIRIVERQLSDEIGTIFPDYAIEFDAKADDLDIEKSVSWFKSNPSLLIGKKDSFMSTVENQGSGVRRTLIWSILRLIEKNKSIKSESSRPYVLLIDEPEICLHPNAIRNATGLLYDIATNPDWQVMLTTHSPIFIDLAKDNTTIIRVGYTSGEVIEGVTLFKSEKSALGDGDRENLKLLNMCDPYVAEFFFSGRVLIVEGDTEFAAFNRIKLEHPTEFDDVHIIRARGKATIVSLIKVLSHYNKGFAVLHDSDSPVRKDGCRNSAWTQNINILEAVAAVKENVEAVRLLATKKNFEYAIFGQDCSSDKPYNAIEQMVNNDKSKAKVKDLLTALVDYGHPAPNYVCEWVSIEELEHFIESPDL